MVLSKNFFHTQKALESFYSYARDFDTISVVYENNLEQHELQKLQDTYPTVRFLNVAAGPINNLINTIEQLHNPYTLIAKDTVWLESDIGIKSCVYQMERTFSYNFLLAINTTDIENERCQHIDNDLYACKFNCCNTCFFSSVDMTLLRRLDLLERLTNITASNLSECIDQLETPQSIHRNNTGLLSSTNVTGAITLPEFSVIQKKYKPSQCSKKVWEKLAKIKKRNNLCKY